MKWLTQWLPGLPHSDAAQTTALPPEIAAQIKAWHALPTPDFNTPHFESHYTVINTETTSLDMADSRLLAVAAITIQSRHITPAASYYTPLTPSPAQTLADLLTFCGKTPLVIFSDINRTTLTQAIHKTLGLDIASMPLLWLDLYTLLPSLFPDRIERSSYLKDWMNTFDMETFLRHHALGDAWIIAQLFLAAQGKARIRGINTPLALAELEHQRHRLMRQL